MMSLYIILITHGVSLGCYLPNDMLKIDKWKMIMLIKLVPLLCDI